MKRYRPSPNAETKEQALDRLKDESAQFDDRQQKAFDFSAEAVKQLINLAVGVIAFTVTFSSSFLSGVNNTGKTIALITWFFYFLSALFGIFTLNALAGELDSSENYITSRENHEIPTPSRPNIAKLWLGQFVTFLIGLFASFCFGIYSFTNQPSSSAQEVKLVLPNSVVQIIQSPRQDSLKPSK